MAIRPISSGDELFISYIDETLPWERRQALLQSGYHFECRCARCIADAARYRGTMAT